MIPASEETVGIAIAKIRIKKMKTPPGARRFFKLSQPEAETRN
jgi:hypothetical protein